MSERTPDVSVIMSVYNTNSEWLGLAIESILQQTFNNFEFIIIDDKSTDGSVHIIQDYAEKDSRIVFLKNGTNLGLTKSLNRGLEIAKGKYIARMDSDDVSVPDRLEYQFQYMESHQDVAVTGGNVYIEGHDSDFITAYNDDADIMKFQMIFHNAGVPHPTAMIRKSFLDENHISYDETILKSQDYALWSEIMAADGKIKILPKILLEYRVHEGQISASRETQNNYAYTVAVKNFHKLCPKATKEQDKLFCGLLDMIPKHDKAEYRKLFELLFQANENAKIFPRQKYERQIYAAWFRLCYLDIRYQKKLRFLLSSYIWKGFIAGGLREYYRTYIRPKKNCRNIRRKYHAAHS